MRGRAGDPGPGRSAHAWRTPGGPGGAEGTRDRAHGASGGTDPGRGPPAAPPGLSVLRAAPGAIGAGVGEWEPPSLIPSPPRAGRQPGGGRAAALGCIYLRTPCQVAHSAPSPGASPPPSRRSAAAAAAAAVAATWLLMGVRGGAGGGRSSLEPLRLPPIASYGKRWRRRRRQQRRRELGVEARGAGRAALRARGSGGSGSRSSSVAALALGAASSSRLARSQGRARLVQLQPRCRRPGRCRGREPTSP